MIKPPDLKHGSERKEKENFMVDFFKDFNNLFSNDEKIILNHTAVEGSKESCCQQLSFDMEVSEDEDCISILQSVYDKICDLSDEEFLDLQKYLPVDVPVTDDDVELSADELENALEE